MKNKSNNNNNNPNPRDSEMAQQVKARIMKPEAMQ